MGNTHSMLKVWAVVIGLWGVLMGFGLVGCGGGGTGDFETDGFEVEFDKGEDTKNLPKVKKADEDSIEVECEADKTTIEGEAKMTCSDGDELTFRCIDGEILMGTLSTGCRKTTIDCDDVVANRSDIFEKKCEKIKKKKTSGPASSNGESGAPPSAPTAAPESGSDDFGDDNFDDEDLSGFEFE